MAAQLTQPKTKSSPRQFLQKVQIQDPRTWVKYRSGMCNSCWSGCCTLPVEVSVHDLIRLELITEEEAATSLKNVAKKLSQAKIIQSYHPKTQLFVLAQKGGRDCIYLDSSRQCTVYDKRPQVCRLFPKIGPRPSYCPQQITALKKRS